MSQWKCPNQCLYELYILLNWSLSTHFRQFNSSRCTLLLVFSYSFGYYQWFLRQSDQYVPSWFALNVLIFHSLPRVKKGNDGKEPFEIFKSKFCFAFKYLMNLLEIYIKRTVFVAPSKELIVYFVPLLVLFMM